MFIDQVEVEGNDVSDITSHENWLDMLWEHVPSFDDHQESQTIKGGLVRIRRAIEAVRGIEQDPDSDRLIAGIVDEMSNNLKSGIGDAYEAGVLVSFYEYAINSLGTMKNASRALRGEVVEVPVASTGAWEELMTKSSVIVNSPVAHFVMQQGWLAQVVWQQRDISLVDRQAWLNGFYEYVMQKNVYKNEVGRALYSADAGLEIDRITSGIATILDGLSVGSVFLHGPGDGLRVDGPVLENLRDKGVVNIDANIVGLDLNSIPNHHPLIDLAQGDLLSDKRIDAEWKHQFQLIIEAGSPRSNMDLAWVQDKYWKSLAKLAADEAIVITDDASLEPIPRDNRRVRHSKDMDLYGHAAGTAPVQSSYWRDGIDTESTPGARIAPVIEKLLLAARYGFECTNLPKMGSVEWYELIGNIHDREWLIKHTNEARNAAQTPFYYAGEAADGSGAMVRSTLIFKKVGNDGRGDMLDTILKNFSRDQLPA